MTLIYVEKEIVLKNMWHRQLVIRTLLPLSIEILFYLRLITISQIEEIIIRACLLLGLRDGQLLHFHNDLDDHEYGPETKQMGRKQ